MDLHEERKIYSMEFSVIRELSKGDGNNSAKLWDLNLLLQTLGAMAGPRAGE